MRGGCQRCRPCRRQWASSWVTFLLRGTEERLPRLLLDSSRDGDQLQQAGRTEHPGRLRHRTCSRRRLAACYLRVERRDPASKPWHPTGHTWYGSAAACRRLATGHTGHGRPCGVPSSQSPPPWVETYARHETTALCFARGNSRGFLWMWVWLPRRRGLRHRGSTTGSNRKIRSGSDHLALGPAHLPLTEGCDSYAETLGTRYQVGGRSAGVRPQPPDTSADRRLPQQQLRGHSSVVSSATPRIELPFVPPCWSRS
jgi:hypothetical protein